MKRLVGNDLLFMFISARFTGMYAPSPANFVVDEVRATKPFWRSPEGKIPVYHFTKKVQTKNSGPKILRPTTVTPSAAIFFVGEKQREILHSSGGFCDTHHLAEF